MLDLLFQRRGHVVAQVVEAELRVGAVRHVGGVRRALVLVGLHVLEHPDGDAERVVDRLHPHRVAAGQIVVDGDDVDAAAGERVEHDGQRRGQGLALAGPHLGDRAVVEHHAADQLHVEVPHAHRALARLAHEREAFVRQVVEAFAAGGALAQLVGGLSQLGVGVVLELGLESINPSNPLFVDLELLRFAHAKRAVQNGHRASVAVGPGRFYAAEETPGGPRFAHPSDEGLVLDRARAGVRCLGRRGACLAPLAPLVAVALDLDVELVSAKIDRVQDVRRGIPSPQRHPLQVQRRLGHLVVGDGRIALLKHLHLEFGELRHLPVDLAKALGDVLPQVLGNWQVPALDLDAHRPTSLLGRMDVRERISLVLDRTFVD